MAPQNFDSNRMFSFAIRKIMIENGHSFLDVSNQIYSGSNRKYSVDTISAYVANRAQVDGSFMDDLFNAYGKFWNGFQNWIDQVNSYAFSTSL